MYISNIFDCHLKKDYQILIIFDTNISDTTGHQMIFAELKAFNLGQLTDFFVTRLESNYERRLMNVASNRVEELRQSRHFPWDSAIALCNVWMLAPDVVSVPSARLADVSYLVNPTVWVCSCPIGVHGAPCKHQWVATAKYAQQSE